MKNKNLKAAKWLATEELKLVEWLGNWYKDDGDWVRDCLVEDKDGTTTYQMCILEEEE